METLRIGNQFFLKINSKMSFPALLGYMEQLLAEREEGSLKAVQLIRETEELRTLNRKLPFIHYLNSNLNHASSKVVALCLAMNYLNRKCNRSPLFLQHLD